MKIAYVHDVIYPYVKGGAERRVWEVSRRLAGRGHEVHIFGMKHWQGDDLVERDGVFLHGVCPPGSLYVGGRRSISAAVRFSARLLPKLRGISTSSTPSSSPTFPASQPSSNPSAGGRPSS